MRRMLGATAVFLGWLCLPLSVVSGLLASRLIGQADTPGALHPDPATVFGVSGDLFVLLVIAGALLTSAPAAAAMFSAKPSPLLYVAGASVAVLAMLLFLDNIGRAYGAVLLPAGAFFAAGGWLMEPRPTGMAWESSGELVAGDEPAGGSTPQNGSELPETSNSAEPSRALVAGVGASAAAPESGATSLCPWCSARIPVEATTCPECHATVDRGLGEGTPISGLTQVSPELQAYSAQLQTKRKRTSLLRRVLGTEPQDTRLAFEPSSGNALLPPSPEVRAEMARIDGEIAMLAVAVEPLPAAPEPGPASEPGPAWEPGPEPEPDLPAEPAIEPPAPARPRRTRSPKA